ncbi:MAG: CAP domain-containing protein [Chthoniobacterales bacterium]
MSSARFSLTALVLNALLTAVASAQEAPRLYSIGNPTGEEQQYLELINRARANPAAEGARLAASTDPDVLDAIAGFGVDLALFQAQMKALPPLAFNGDLLAAARAHTQDMFAHAYQDHIGTDGSSTSDRISAQGYDWSADGENIFSYSKSVIYGHAAFEIDWGGTPASGGMQVPSGHRNNIHSTFFREIGVGVIDGTNGVVGPQIVTQDFAAPLLIAPPLLTGVVYSDVNGNGFYDPSEGVGGVTISVAGASYYAISAASGGYAVPLPNDDTYNVTFAGGGQPDVEKVAVVAGGQNVKLDDVRAAVLPSTPRLVNISTRMQVGTGDNALIGGFILTGSASEKVIIRGIGPSLTINGALQNPTLDLYDGAGRLMASNDNWQTNSNAQEIIASTVAPTNPKEPAILTTLPANGSAYTAIVRGANDTTGIGLVEVYDLDAAGAAQLANISTRGLVETGDNVMIGGFIVAGKEAANVIVRAIGPSLGVAGELADPTLELVNGNGVSLGANDNWRSDQESEILATQVAPTRDAEAALVRTLAPGAYTAIVRGAQNSSGIAIVEAYNLP